MGFNIFLLLLFLNVSLFWEYDLHFKKNNNNKKIPCLPGYSLVSIPYDTPETCLLSEDRCWAFSKISALFFFSSAGSDWSPTSWATINQQFGEENAFISLLLATQRSGCSATIFGYFQKVLSPTDLSHHACHHPTAPSSPGKAKKTPPFRGQKKTPALQRSREGGDPWRRAGEPSSMQGWGDARGVKLGTAGGMLGTTASLTGDAYQAAQLHSESSLQAGEAFEVRGESLKTSSLPKQCFALRSLASFCLTFFFFLLLFFHPTVF